MHQNVDIPSARLPWRPGTMPPGVTWAMPSGATQGLMMLLIGRALAKGMDPGPLERVEATISITDDAIIHMMRKS